MNSNSHFLQLQLVLLDRGNWPAQRVSPEVLGLIIVFYCESLFSPAAASLTAWNTLVLFIYFFFLSLSCQFQNCCLRFCHSSVEDDIETENHTICGFAVKGNGLDFF